MSPKQSEIVQKIGKTCDLGPQGRVFEIASLKPGAHGIKMTAAPCNRLAFAL
jgi:hypothetical protein